MMMRCAGAAIAILVLAACAEEVQENVVVPTVVVGRQPLITLEVDASGAVQPVSIIQIKSKASGEVTRMPVETGDRVKQGDTLAQIDPRLMDQTLERAVADSLIARQRYEVAVTTRLRDSLLFNARITTESAFESGRVDVANALSALDRTRIAVATAAINQADATVIAPIDGVILQKPVTEGAVVQSSQGNSQQGGTTLLMMADLSALKVIARFNENDVGVVEPGLIADLSVDAFPGEKFPGFVEKVEPIATVDQAVTLFPTTISLDNKSGRLKPGMTADIKVHVDQRKNVVALPNDALRDFSDVRLVAPAVGWDPDSLTAAVARLRAEANAASSLGGVGKNGPPRATQASAAGHFSSKTSGVALPSGFVFVATPSGGWEPRVPLLGLHGDKYTEIISGLKEGDVLGMLTSPVIQARRRMHMDSLDAAEAAAKAK